MKNFNVLFLIALFLTACSFVPKKNHLGQELIPLEHFFKKPLVESYSISPNGRYLAYLAPHQSRRNIFVHSVESATVPQRLTRQADRDIAHFFWKGSDTLLFLSDSGDEGVSHVFRVSLVGGGEENLTAFEGVEVRLIDDLDRIDPHHILVSMNKRDKDVFDAYRLNVKTGQLAMISRNPGTVSGWMADRNGKLRFAMGFEEDKVSLFYRADEEQELKEIKTTDFKTTMTPILFTYDSKRLYMASNLNRDKMAIVIFDPIGRREVRTVYQREDVDVTSLGYSNKRQRTLYASFVTEKKERKFFDKVAQDMYGQLEDLFPADEIEITSSDESEQKHVVRTYSDKSMGAYYLYNSESKELQWLKELSPWINASQMAEMQPIQFPSRDGLTINGYLTLPRGNQQKNLPTVVLLGKRSSARDVWGYRPDVQFFANRGYAVLQVNFRGSKGYGKKFHSYSQGEWSGKIQSDITDGLNYLIKRGIADKNKIGICGEESHFLSQVLASGAGACSVYNGESAHGIQATMTEVFRSSARNENRRSSTEESRAEMYSRMESFLERHLLSTK